MENRIKKNENKYNKKTYTFNKKWRILLVDDHAYEPMNGKTGDYDNKNNPSKLDIIVSRLKKYDDVKIITQERNGVWKGDRNDYNIAIECQGMQHYSSETKCKYYDFDNNIYVIAEHYEKQENRFQGFQTASRRKAKQDHRPPVFHLPDPCRSL